MNTFSAVLGGEGHCMNHSGSRLRVALLAGTLGQGGAEKQLVYVARALRRSNVGVQVYSLRRDEFYDAALQGLNLGSIWVGRHESPWLRLGAFVRALWTYEPHVIQSGHFFGNIYVALAARLLGAVSIGSIRSDVFFEWEEMGRWAPWMLRLPGSIIANSHAAVENLKGDGFPETKCHVVPSVIDLAEFDVDVEGRSIGLRSGSPLVVTVGLLDRVKRVDRFIDVLALARRSMPGLRGIIIGDGPERSQLENVAREKGLLPDGLQFLGRRDDVPVLLRQADVFLLTSEHEGLPNVLLEAMASRLPVVTTPAGDAARVVGDGTTGYVVACDDMHGMAQRLLQLAGSPRLRRQFGDAGRQRVERYYSYAGLGQSLLAAYHAIATEQRHPKTLRVLEQQMEHVPSV
jgi:glycosyltransferase involved in cell wall biosynthesis